MLRTRLSPAWRMLPSLLAGILLVPLCASSAPAAGGVFVPGPAKTGPNPPLDRAIEVYFADGTRLSVDRIGPESNRHHMALRLESRKIVLTRLVPWHRIDSARIGDQVFERVILQKYFAMKSDTALAMPGRSAAAGSDVGTAVLPTQSSVISIHDEFPVPANVAVDFKEPEPSGDVQAMGPPLAAAPWNAFCHPTALALEATVLGVRRDPLSAYPELLKRFFSDGVPVSETPVVLDLLRARKGYEVFSGNQRVDKLPAPPKPPAGRENVIRRIRNVSVRVRPVSSNGKVDWDALQVEVAARDRSGRPAAVRGTLRATLWGQEQRLIRSMGEGFIAQPGRIEKVATWVRALDARYRAEQPIAHRLTLPLPRPLPDHDLRRAAFGELHVQLAVPGAGVFETTQRNVLLRHLSPLRDQNLVETRSRFFSEENTHDARLPAGLLFRKYSSARPNGRLLTIQP